MKSSALRWAIAFIALPAFQGAGAANISTMKLDNGGTALLLTGDIKPGDGARFRAEASKYSDSFVLLESDGGSLADALDIGETIHLKGWPTAVFNGSSCNSACALIWLAGTPRGLSQSGKIGFHAAYTDSSGSAKESGVANAMVGRYLTLLNLPEKAVIFATSSPPSQLSWLTASNYASTGIDIKVLDDLDLTNQRTASARQSSAPPTIETVTAPPSANASSESSVWKKMDEWTVYIDHTLDDGCFLFGEFENDTLFRLGVNRQSGNPYYLLLANPEWKSVQAGQHYDVEFQFDTNSPWNVPTTGKAMGETIALAATFTDASFWNEFTSSRALNVTRAGKEVTKLDLTGAKAAYDELVACQRYEDKNSRSRDPFAQ